jgi:hypothetical protein
LHSTLRADLPDPNWDHSPDWDHSPNWDHSPDWDRSPNRDRSPDRAPAKSGSGLYIDLLVKRSVCNAMA